MNTLCKCGHEKEAHFSKDHPYIKDGCITPTCPCPYFTPAEPIDAAKKKILEHFPNMDRMDAEPKEKVRDFLSGCHAAPIIYVWTKDISGAKHFEGYECSECGQPCNLAAPSQPFKAPLKVEMGYQGIINNLPKTFHKCDCWIDGVLIRPCPHTSQMKLQEIPPPESEKKIVYGVITRIPDPENDDGNLYNPILYKEGGGINKSAMRYNPYAEVFALGEVLLLDGEWGREIYGMKRKPSKWDVDCEEYETLEAAIKRAEEINISSLQ